MNIKNWIQFNEHQVSMDFTGKLGSEIITKLREKEELIKKNIEKFKYDSDYEILNKIQSTINGEMPFTFDNYIMVAGDKPKNTYDIFDYGNSVKIARKITEIISRYKKNEVDNSSVPAAGGWSGTMRSTISGSITPVVNFVNRGGTYGFNRNIIIGVKIGAGINNDISDKIKQECYEVFYTMDEYNSSDGGVCIEVSNGTNYDLIGLNCEKFKFGELMKKKLIGIMMDDSHVDEKKTDKEIIDLISSDMYNYLVKIHNSTKDENIKKHADILMSQLNTAGGSHLIKDEVINFIYVNKKMIPEFVL